MLLPKVSQVTYLEMNKNYLRKAPHHPFEKLYAIEHGLVPGPRVYIVVGNLGA